MNIVHVPVFDYIIDTLGNQLKPTITPIGMGLSEVQWSGVTPLKHILFNIGPWNMDSTSFKYVDVGILFPSQRKVIGVVSCILPDPDSLVTPRFLTQASDDDLSLDAFVKFVQNGDLSTNSSVTIYLIT